MRNIVFDIETTAIPLTNELPDRIHVCVCYEPATKEVTIFREGDADKAREFFSQPDVKWIGHNIIMFDNPVLKKVWDIDINWEDCFDTIVMARFERPGELNTLAVLSKLAGGEIKTGHDDWTQWSQEMEDYCIQDCKASWDVCKMVAGWVKKQPKEARRLEHQTQYYLSKQKQAGLMIDYPLVASEQERYTKLWQRLEAEMIEDFPPRKEYHAVPLRYKKDGTLHGIQQKKLDSGLAYEEDGHLVTCTTIPFDAGSRKEILLRLDGHWEPWVMTKKGNPKINEDNLATLTSTAPASLKKIPEAWHARSRAKLLDTIMIGCDANCRVHGDVKSIGAGTYRMAHSNPNTGNMPKDMRDCFKVKDDHVLVGCDASGIQLRAMAHYIKNQEVVDEILNGDIHSYMRDDMYGIPWEGAKEGAKMRSKSKTVTYTILMGGSPPAVAAILGKAKSFGSKVMRNMANKLVGWTAFKDRIRNCARKGYLKTLDGRCLKVKSQHHCMSQFLQSFEQVIMKYAMVMTNVFIEENNLPAEQVAIVHDEIQLEVHDPEARRVADKWYPLIEAEQDDKVAESMAEQMMAEMDLEGPACRVGAQVRAMIVKGGEVYKSFCPLDGEYMIGRTWKETH